MTATSTVLTPKRIAWSAPPRRRVRRTATAVLIALVTLAGSLTGSPTAVEAKGLPDLSWSGSPVFFGGEWYAFENIGGSAAPANTLLRYQSEWPFSSGSISAGDRVEIGIRHPWNQNTSFYTARVFAGDNGEALLKIRDTIHPGTRIFVRAPLGLVTIDPLNKTIESNETNNSQVLSRPFF